MLVELLVAVLAVVVLIVVAVAVLVTAASSDELAVLFLYGLAVHLL